MKIFTADFSGEFLTLNWPHPHYCYHEWRKSDIEIMVVSLTYSTNFLKTIGQKAHTAPNFHHFYLILITYRKIIVMGIHRYPRSYRRSRAGTKLFHEIKSIIS